MRILILLTGIITISFSVPVATGQVHNDATQTNITATHPDSVKLIAEGEHAYYQKTVKVDSIPLKALFM